MVLNEDDATAEPIDSALEMAHSDYGSAPSPADCPIAAQSFSRKAAGPRASVNCRADRSQHFFEFLPILAYSRGEPAHQPLYF
jgi:hypothetical protein